MTKDIYTRKHTGAYLAMINKWKKGQISKKSEYFKAHPGKH